jgi:hypothetical protein
MLMYTTVNPEKKEQTFFGFTVEAVVEIGESSARVWPFGTRCWGLSAWLV